MISLSLSKKSSLGTRIVALQLARRTARRIINDIFVNVCFKWVVIINQKYILYSVKQGDSLYRIANIFNIEIQDILDINAIEENQIKPGQVIKIIIKAF